MKKLLVNSSAVLAAAMTAFPLPAFAQAFPDIPQDSVSVGDNVGQWLRDNILYGIANWLLVIAGALAIIYLIWAGIQYITGVGGGADAAKKQIINAVIGIIIIVLAYAIVTAVISLVGG
ncbi:hypothetical protein DRH29_02530 [candidate division Kazan bacterium]|uniref:TIGR03745 family integrating conjugative element membrane protein n=1 Tax=candidate division Kazan bacterium TaxID=2202143 RepID=A0A420ZCZ5_UNCK3|nr:MAG: hypothetical protein DRH29_02530 [candidate division Kazan bacterium]